MLPVLSVWEGDMSRDAVRLFCKFREIRTGNDNGFDLQNVGCGGMDWIDLAQDRNRWRAL